MSTKIKNFLKVTLECTIKGIIIGVVVVIIERIFGW